MKLYGVTLLIAMLISVTACSPIENIDEDITENISIEDIENYNIYDEQEKLIIPENLVYSNYECGYEITFPESWRDYFVIDESNPYAVGIHFVGKSKTGSILLKEYGITGLPWFSIMSKYEIEQNWPLDNVRKIGIIGETDYYYATGSSGTITALLTIAGKEYATRQMAERLYDVNETELQLAAQDWEKVEQMTEELDDILKTFTLIYE